MCVSIQGQSWAASGSCPQAMLASNFNITISCELNSTVAESGQASESGGMHDAVCGSG